MKYERKVSESQVHLINVDGTRLEQLLLADLSHCEACLAAALAERDAAVKEVERLKGILTKLASCSWSFSMGRERKRVIQIDDATYHEILILSDKETPDAN